MINILSAVKKIKSGQQGNALLLTLLILFTLLTITLGLTGLIINSLRANRSQKKSIMAYYAAEAGLERSLWEVRKNGYALPAASQDDVFSVSDLGNGCAYYVNYASSSPVVTFDSNGVCDGIARGIEANFTVVY